MATVLGEVSSQVLAGQPIPAATLETLWSEASDLVALGMVADEARRKRHGSRTTFVRVAEIPLEAVAHVPIPPAAGEVRLVGTPASPGDAVAAVREAVRRAAGIPVTAFTLAALSRMAGGTEALRELVTDLTEAGLAAVAEATVDEHDDLRRDVEAVRDAGAAIARFTIRRWPAGSPVPTLQDVRRLQKTSGVVRSFAPLAREIDHARPTTGYDDVKVVALARLALHDVPSIQVDWRLYGPKLAQVALLFGADDVDGVQADDEAPHGPRRAPLEEILRNIRAAALEPVERDGRRAVREA